MCQINLSGNVGRKFLDENTTLTDTTYCLEQRICLFIDSKNFLSIAKLDHLYHIRSEMLPFDDKTIKRAKINQTLHSYATRLGD